MQHPLPNEVGDEPGAPRQQLGVLPTRNGPPDPAALVTRSGPTSDLWSAGYGQVLLVKLALVSLALLWGAAHHFIVRPALERGAPLFAGLPRSLIGESAVGIAILLVAAILVESKPPARPATPQVALHAPAP